MDLVPMYKVDFQQSDNLNHEFDNFDNGNQTLVSFQHYWKLYNMNISLIL